LFILLQEKLHRAEPHPLALPPQQQMNQNWRDDRGQSAQQS
jgi:hypothetical protein